MKIDVRGKPVFNIHFPLPLLYALRECSRLHYDGACRQMSQEAVGGFENGLITQMIVNAEFMKADGEEREMSWRELDLLSKVCEGYRLIHTIDGAHEMIADFLKSIRAAFNLANQNSVYWRLAVNV